ncbi:MAG: DUF1761 domain-containing protein [Halioglobus sp.]
MDIEIKLLAVLVATLAGMMLGAFWYSPIAFGKAWMDSIGKTEEQLGSATGPMIGSVIACLITAISLSIVISMCGISDAFGGAMLGGLIGLGIVFPALLSDSLFCGWGSKLLMIQSGYRVVYAIVMGAIIGGWPA